MPEHPRTLRLLRDCHDHALFVAVVGMVAVALVLWLTGYAHE